MRNSCVMFTLRSLWDDQYAALKKDLVPRTDGHTREAGGDTSHIQVNV